MNSSWRRPGSAGRWREGALGAGGVFAASCAAASFSSSFACFSWSLATCFSVASCVASKACTASSMAGFSCFRAAAISSIAAFRSAFLGSPSSIRSKALRAAASIVSNLELSWAEELDELALRGQHLVEKGNRVIDIPGLQADAILQPAPIEIVEAGAVLHEELRQEIAPPFVANASASASKESSKPSISEVLGTHVTAPRFWSYCSPSLHGWSFRVFGAGAFASGRTDRSDAGPSANRRRPCRARQKTSGR
jgi:hypothetical protein